ncbi:Polyketide cyclase/dehydrase and lipid transport superfamily protein [Hibiscus syriacus]|uniref:Polyketide cyclase/dehydrase and lipid transport superfamily protein n=1 Tax=Hibiscus syriacus TaxID=106335 RepID=A0A6A3BI96_HIBSY|nr:Polyketide cyclase/dehydrase and lipid transport superfamily protein [Hibiscus syriacus]
MALQTWAQWLEVHVNTNKTKIFFMSMSPTHQKAAKWGGIVGENCYSETELVTEEGYVGDGASPRMMHVVDNVLDELKSRGLKEALGNNNRRTISESQKLLGLYSLVPPRVPDVWNELLYAYILQL